MPNLKRVYIEAGNQVKSIPSSTFSNSTVEYIQFENLTELESLDGVTNTKLKGDIDLSKTSADGSKLLKDYLECAEHGMERLGKDLLVDPNAEPDSDFEVDVYNVLKDAGYEIDMQVGCSGYRIDLGVKHPLKSDYVLAVECDGATYHSGKTTRDRDRLRQEVLENLGWRFYRIWSTDWFKNREVEVKKLLATVDRAIKKFDAEHNITNDFKPVEKPSEKEEIVEDISVNGFLNVIQEEKKDIKTLFKTYEEYDIYSQGLPSFATTIYPLVEKEGPITEELLLTKIAPFFGREKVTNVVRYEFNDRMRYIKDVHKVGEYYVTDVNKKIEMRIPKEGETPRDIKDICNAELSSGLYVVIQNNIGINKQDLFQTITNLLGFERMGNNIQFKLDQALNELLRNRKIKEVNQQYFVKNEEDSSVRIEADDLGW
jgi:very-short-patch-repair endonuclease